MRHKFGSTELHEQQYVGLVSEQRSGVDYSIVFTNGPAYDPADRRRTYRDSYDGHTRVYEKEHGLVVKVGTRLTFYPWHAIQSVTEEPVVF